jgi:type 1 glutamine amidotransferase
LFFTSLKKIATFSYRCNLSRQAFTLSSNFLTHMKNKSLLILSALAMMSVLPAAAAAEPKRMVVCTITEGFRHSSIPQSEKALQAIDEASPNLEIVKWLRQPEIEVPVAPRPPKEPADKASQDKYQRAMQAWDRDVKPEADRKKRELHEAVKKSLLALSPQALRDNRIDAVIFSNTTGNLPLPDLQGFADWVRSGGAFIGMHSATDTLKGALPYTEMICGIFEGHREQVPVKLHAGDKEHPANAGIGAIWTLAQEEMYLIKQHDRNLVRSIWFMRHHPNDPKQEGFFPVAWVRKFGEGRVFYTSLGHREDLWSTDPALPDRINSVETAAQFRKHLTGGIRWAVGLETGSSEPNPQTN